MNFNQLHAQGSPLLICNVWDVASAKTAQKLNFKAIGTSSGAMANMLGYQDGEEMSLGELVYMVERITQSVNLPLTVDLEAGYSRTPTEIAEHIIQLAHLGVVGVNLEDSIVNEKRELVAAASFAKLLQEVATIVKQHQSSIFINVRTDTFLLNIPNKLEETLARGHIYEQAGADGLFVPCVENEKDINTIIQGTILPLNVMCMPALPDFNTLAALGVRRISMGNFVFNHINHQLKKTLKDILHHHSFQNLFHS
ncbi:MAG: isocitrate lyase/phosphoenolpyruvate mutase family protein [Bacteroidota bacterium]